jgi:hypothetical protein
MPDQLPTGAECRRVDPGAPPATDRSSRAISSRVYHLERLRQLLRARHVLVATAKARRDLENLDWKIVDLCACGCALSDAEYKKSEWARTSQGLWVACDVFAFAYCETRRRVVTAHDPLPKVHLYLKMGLGPVLSPHVLICSVHA